MDKWGGQWAVVCDAVIAKNIQLCDLIRCSSPWLLPLILMIFLKSFSCLSNVQAHNKYLLNICGNLECGKLFKFFKLGESTE